MKKIITILILLICVTACDKNNTNQNNNVNNQENTQKQETIKDYDDTLGIGVNTNNFPDSEFIKYIKENIDIDKNNYLSNEEIEKTKTISITRSSDGRREVEFLKGIEIFKYLENLEFNDCYKIYEIPLSCFPELKKLKLNGMFIENIDISKNLKLNSISIYFTNISNVSIYSQAESVEMSMNTMKPNTIIDISNCPYFKNNIYNYAFETVEQYQQGPKISGLYITAAESNGGYIKVICDDKDVLCTYNESGMGFEEKRYDFGQGTNKIENKMFDSYEEAFDYGFNGNKWYRIIERISKDGVWNNEISEACWVEPETCAHQYEVIVYDKQPF